MLQMRRSLICPKCKKTLYYEIDDNSAMKSGGLIPITIIHGYPDAHALVVYVDTNGANRGYEVIENLVDLRSNFDAREILNIIGEKKIAKIIASIVGGLTLYIEGDPESIKLLHIFLSKILKNQFFSLADNEKLADIKISIIKKKNNPKVPGEKYILSLLRKGRKMSESGYVNMLNVEISKLKTKIRKVIDVLERRNISKTELMEELEINDREFELIIQFIKTKRPNLIKNLVDSLLDIL